LCSNALVAAKGLRSFEAMRSEPDLWTLEVKSGRPRPITGLASFRRDHPQAKTLLIGPGDMDLEEFFSTDPRELLV
jgi:hypothetical protein